MSNTENTEKVNLSFVNHGTSYTFEVDENFYNDFQNKNPETIYRVLYPNTLPWYSEKEDVCTK